MKLFRSRKRLTRREFLAEGMTTAAGVVGLTLVAAPARAARKKATRKKTKRKKATRKKA